MPATANGQPVLTLEITWPRQGNWTADLGLDAAEPLSGAVEIDIEGQAWNGTVKRASADSSRGGTQIVGGAGGLKTIIEAKNYAPAGGVLPSTIVDDIMRETGETLSPTADTELLSNRLRTWQRSEDSADKALTILAEKLEANWRVLRDGTIWIGIDAYPEAEIEHTVISENLQAGSVVVAYEGTEQPLLEPGVTFRGKRIEQVVHTIGKTLRTEAKETSGRASLDKLNGDVYQRIDYSRPYSARVVQQHEDGTLDLLPDDKLFAGKGVGRVPIWLGVPGSVKVPKGQRVMLEYAAGDPSRPIVRCFEMSTVTLLNLGVGNVSAAIAELCDENFAALRDWVVAHTHPTGMGPSGPPTEAPQLTPLTSVVSQKIKIES